MAKSGVYKINSGEFFYIGSTSDFDKRKRDHLWRLKKGTHHSAKLQAAFAETGEACFFPVKIIKECPNFSNALKSAEQVVLDFYSGNPMLANKSPNAFGPDNGELLSKVMREKWEIPMFRNYQEILRETPRICDAETREKMAAAKRGARNVNSRPVIVTHPDKSTTSFPCVSDAAKFFKVSQQIMDLWIRGVVPWPGMGRRTKKENDWIAEYSAKIS